MSFPPVPGPRTAYDRDGSVVTIHDGVHAPTVATAGQLVTLNDEADIGDLTLGTNTYIALLFPSLRDIIAFGGRFGTQGTYVLQYSANTTNGLDGTWTNGSGAINNTDFNPAGIANRTTFTSQSISSVSAIRFFISGLGVDTTAYGIHLYSSISAGQVLDRLEFSDNFGNPLVGSFFDFGDVAQSSSADLAFNLVNRSVSRTASTIQVFTEVLTDTTPSVAAQYFLSIDGVTFSSSLNVSSLTPGQMQAMTLRRVTPSNASLSVWSPRLVARAGAWA